jgi:outer membrane receptor protein involved in Fe transport
MQKKLHLFLAMLMLYCSVQVFAQAPLLKKIALSIQGASPKKALEEIQKASGARVLFGEDIDRFSANKVNINSTAITVKQALELALTNTNLSWELTGNHILIKEKTVTPQTAPKKSMGRITGRIIDEETSYPVEGATVMISNKGITTDHDGAFSLSLPEGNYTATISFIGFASKEITDIEVKSNQNFELNATLKREKGQLSSVVVKSSARKESIVALYARQKNAAILSDGISSQQISATPDRHVGDVLKRITGVSTQENRKVVVRGIAERYNTALLNGSPLPSTDVQERDFEFNLIPANLVENIIVAKSITADMPYGFAGGMVQINTRSIPSSNFTSISAGLSINSRTMGKDFLSYRRGKYDYLGFDDGDRDHFPDGLIDLIYRFNPLGSDDHNEIKVAQVAEQNKKIGGTERLGTRVYQPMPSQNYQLSLGRAYSLSNTKKRELGFVGALTYRNSQNNSYIANMRRGSWSANPPFGTDKENTGNEFVFNTTIGAMLNAGFKTKNHQFNTYNLYTRIFENRFSRITGWDTERPNDPFPGVQEDDRPKFSDLLQNKISGTHNFKPFLIEWSATRTHLKSVEKDAAAATLSNRELGNKAPLYEYFPNQASDPGFGTIHRDQYTYIERNLEANINISYLFKLGKTTHTVKSGFNYLGKHAWYSWVVLPIAAGEIWGSNYHDVPLQEWGNFMTMEKMRTDYFYNPSIYSLNGYEGKSKNMGTYAMFDHKLLHNLRLVWGLRADYFRLDTLKNAASLQSDAITRLIFSEKKDWYLLPSASITYTLFNDLNIRAAYAKTVVRPGLMENSRFSRYNPNYGTMIRSSGVSSTLIDNYDLKMEWFPAAGEIISAGYFYKYFDKPAEYYRKNNMSGGTPYITVTNSDWAKVSGWEFELRKSLGFLSDRFLKNIYVSGNLTLQDSKVRAREVWEKQLPDGTDSLWYTYMKNPRALYGQIPVLYNLGLQYMGSKLGLNLVYNHMGYKTFVTASSPDLVEYERPRGQLDAQISYRFMNGKMEAKFNLTNITDAPVRYFINDNSTFDPKPNPPIEPEWHEAFEYKPGFSEKFEEGYIGPNKIRVGDRKTLIRYLGRTFGFTITYNL